MSISRLNHHTFSPIHFSSIYCETTPTFAGKKSRDFARGRNLFLFSIYIDTDLLFVSYE